MTLIIKKPTGAKLVMRKQPSPWAEGGDLVYTIVVDGITYRVHEFRTVGASPLTVMVGGVFEYLVIGGGGGANNGGGGGAGGYRCSVPGELSGGGANAESPLSLTQSSYTITVGGGGFSGGSTGNGSNSSIGALVVSIGGGATGQFNNSAGQNGGSGGGGTLRSFVGTSVGGAGTSGQGYAGGSAIRTIGSITRGAPGGGAGGPGANVVDEVSGVTAGGVGLISSITGTPTLRASGGQSGVNQSALPNTGTGGSSSVSATSGGSGIVIVRYAI